MKLKEKLSREYRIKDWPLKNEWERDDRYETRFAYEIGDYVEEAYEAAFEKAKELLFNIWSCKDCPWLEIRTNDLKGLGEQEVE